MKENKNKLIAVYFCIDIRPGSFLPIYVAELSAIKREYECAG